MSLASPALRSKDFSNAILTHDRDSNDAVRNCDYEMYHYYDLQTRLSKSCNAISTTLGPYLGEHVDII